MYKWNYRGLTEYVNNFNSLGFINYILELGQLHKKTANKMFEPLKFEKKKLNS